jgi:hypothetical protein
MRVVWSQWLAVATAAVSIGAAVSSCSSSSASPVGLADTCSVNSDCNAPLVCVFAKCHEACAETRDCPTGERCVSAGQYDVCTLPQEEACTAGATPSTCPGTLVCGADGQCRNGCASSDQCVPGQSCSAAACIEEVETNPGGPSDGGADGAGGPSPDATLADAPVDAPADSPFVPDEEAGPLGFFPTNFSPAQADAGTWGAPDGIGGGTAVAQDCTNTCVGAAVTVAQNDADGTLADVYLLDSLTIDATATLTLTGPRPIILAVRGAVDIQGLLVVAASGSAAGPGGFGSLANRGPGGGSPGNFAAYPQSYAGGASYCGVGGKGGSASAPGAPGGVVYGNPTLHPLVGGSAGGDYSYYGDQPGGSGGGALEIVSATSISVGANGAIHAGGGGQTGGGGSGGAILLEAPAVSIHGQLAANGGGGGAVAIGGNATANDQPAPGYAGSGGNGSAASAVNGSDGTTGDGGPPGSGGGGAGRIRINTASGRADVTGAVSPGLDTPCATQGPIAR